MYIMYKVDYVSQTSTPSGHLQETPSFPPPPPHRAAWCACILGAAGLRGLHTYVIRTRSYIDDSRLPPPPLSLGTVRSPAEERTSASRASKTMYRSPCGVTAWLYYVYGWLVIYLLTYFLRVHVGGGGGWFPSFFLLFSLFIRSRATWQYMYNVLHIVFGGGG